MSVGNEGAQVAPSALNVVSETPEVETEAQDTAPEAEAKPEAKRLNKLKLKVHGEEYEESLPFDIEEGSEAVEYLTKNLQLGKAAQRAMQEKASYESQVKQFFQGFKSDTKAALIQMGIDPKEFAAAVIEEEIKKAQLTPEQRAQEELQEELRKEREARQKEKEDWEQKELSRIQQVEYERIDSQMTEALESSDLPKTPYVVRKIAEYMLVGSKRGVDLTAKDVLPLVREELLSDLKSIINSLGEDAAEEFIGKEVLTRFRKKNLAKAKTPTTPATIKSAIKEVNQNGAKPKPTGKDNVDYKKFFGF
jgi:hypothetical protein